MILAFVLAVVLAVVFFKLGVYSVLLGAVELADGVGIEALRRALFGGLHE